MIFFPIKPLTVIVFSVLLLSACSKAPNHHAEDIAPQSSASQASSEHTAPSTDAQANDTNRDSLPIGDNSRNALDWPGIYQGTLPCASCEGLLVQLTLMADGQYTLSTEYLGKGNAPLKEHGQFMWNPSGSVVQLDNNQQFQVGENQLFMLDVQGRKITGALADNYRLIKTSEPK